MTSKAIWSHECLLRDHTRGLSMEQVVEMGKVEIPHRDRYDRVGRHGPGSETGWWALK